MTKLTIIVHWFSKQTEQSYLNIINQKHSLMDHELLAFKFIKAQYIYLIKLHKVSCDWLVMVKVAYIRRDIFSFNFNST